MTNQEILEKAKDKAIANGWNSLMTKAEWSSDALIYRHDFAKALWGEDRIEELISRKSGTSDNIITKTYRDLGVAWKHHLQQMVVAEDPIKYLGENI